MVLKMKSPVAMRFSAAAQTYDGLAYIQRKAAERLMALLENCPMPERILEIGCGTGILTALLSRRFPSASIDAVDISPAMIARARRNLKENRQINWMAADARHLPPLPQYDLIASNCALHWLTPLEPVFKRLGALLNPGGRLAAAIMTQGTFAELHASRNRVAPHKPPRIKMPPEGKICEAILKAGLTIAAKKIETLRQAFSSAGEMVRHMHQQGLTGGNDPSDGRVLTRTELSELINDYNSNYKNNDGVFASYSLYCIIGIRRI